MNTIVDLKAHQGQALGDGIEEYLEEQLLAALGAYHGASLLGAALRWVGQWLHIGVNRLGQLAGPRLGLGKTGATHAPRYRLQSSVSLQGE